jgi:hypothetical protein
MNWAGLGRKRSWPDMKYFSRNILEVLRKNMENFFRRAGLRENSTGVCLYQPESVVILLG